MAFLGTLWADDAGFIISAELVLVATIVVIGMIIGLVIVRNQVVQELADVGQAIGSLSQTYAYSGLWNSHHPVAMTDGSFYHDVKDYCQTGWCQAPGEPAAGITFSAFPCGLSSPPGGER